VERKAERKLNKNCARMRIGVGVGGEKIEEVVQGKKSRVLYDGFPLCPCERKGARSGGVFSHRGRIGNGEEHDKAQKSLANLFTSEGA